MKRGDGFFFAGLLAFVVFCVLGLSGNLPGQCELPSNLLVCQGH